MLNPLCCVWEHPPANNRRAQKVRYCRAFPRWYTDLCQGQFKFDRRLDKTAGHAIASPIYEPNRARRREDEMPAVKLGEAEIYYGEHGSA
jgi:hypothetical protein